MAGIAYLDSSAFLAMSFHQPEGRDLRRRLRSIHRLIASDLLISEVCSAFQREGLPLEPLARQLAALDIITTSLTTDILAKVLEVGYARGADAHHLASAFWFCSGATENLYFISLDAAQLSSAKKLGFKV